MTLSVVVPIYNVEEYLERCLDTIAAQTWEDLEVVLVNDGATDSSPEIAEAYTKKDPRFKLVHRPNGGLSAARNTGIEHATGEYLSFVDSDDELPDNAYELLAGSLEQTGSDFATGKVLRLTPSGTKPTRFLKATFAETRLRTHITKFRPLLADRIAWNKVFRRSFWDAHGLRFPEGRINEDIPVMIPLHFAAAAVDVISEPIYLWRFREVGELSITERRAELHALENRLMAVTDVHDYLAANEPPAAKRWYDEVLVADDLKYYVNVLDRASDEYREVFLDRVNALLDSADDDIYDGLPAIERLKWHLVRRRLLPELLEVLRFWRDELDDTPPVRENGVWYGEYPYRHDERLAIPESVYRVGDEMWLFCRIDAMAMEDGRLRIDGRAYVDGVGAAEPGSQKVRVSLVRPGRLMKLRHMLPAARFRVQEVHRPDANALGSQRIVDVSWSGFTATLDPGKLRRRRDQRLELYVTVEAGGVKRRGKNLGFESLRRPKAVELPAPEGIVARAATFGREVFVELASTWAALRSCAVDGDELVLSGELRGVAPEKLECQERAGKRRKRVPLSVDGSAFTARVPLSTVVSLRAAGEEDEDEEPDAGEGRDPGWELLVAGGGQKLPLWVGPEVPPETWPVAGRAVALVRDRAGHASLFVRERRVVVADARFEGDELVVDGEGAFVLFSPDRLAQHDFQVPGRARPGAIDSLDGPLPLPEGWWRVCARSGESLLPVAPDAGLRARLPAEAVIRHKRFTLAVSADDQLVVVVGRDIGEDERGPFQQRVLRRTAYAGRRAEPLTDTVVYSSFRGRQYSDSPRAIHEELVRRGVDLEHLWAVRDGACNVPDTARVLREGSREYHEALARSRFLVVNDHFPDWFERRDDQVCVQTWHGTPLKKLGFDVSALRGNQRRFERNWDAQLRNWQYVVSPNRFATPILERAYRLESEMLETGYPRDDLLAGAAREAATRELRARLGIPEGVRVLLYAPTFRDHVRDGRGRYRLDLRLDLDRLRDAAGPDTLLLVRKHHYIVDELPSGPDGFVRDVSTYPDGTELLLAADVLITDYSSMTVDFANTGRPILFFTYDLDAYADEIRGFYVDFEATVPGPLLTTSNAVGEALRDLDSVRAQYADRYAAFVAKFCELDDGGAAARVVDRVFSGRLPDAGTSAAGGARGPSA